MSARCETSLLEDLAQAFDAQHRAYDLAHTHAIRQTRSGSSESVVEIRIQIRRSTDRKYLRGRKASSAQLARLGPDREPT